MRNYISIGVIAAVTVALILGLSSLPEEHSRAVSNSPVVTTNSSKEKIKSIKQASVEKITLDLKSAPESLAQIFSEDVENPQRIKAVDNLSRDLTDIERDYLYAFIKQTESDQFTLWMKDEILCKLETQYVRPAEYEQALADIATY